MLLHLAALLPSDHVGLGTLTAVCYPLSHITVRVTYV